MLKTHHKNIAPSDDPNPGRGHLFIISAPSGAGKTTMCRALRERFPDIRYSISYTTRPPRSGEQNGVDYHFITKEAFHAQLTGDRWAEWAEVHGNYYGTSAEFLENTIADGKDVLLDIDVQGAQKILTHFPNSVTIFIMPPSMSELKQRLTGRGTDSPEDIERRLVTAATEIAQKDLYRHIIINDQLDQAVSTFISLVKAYRQARPVPSAAAGKNAGERS